ncbi:MAG: hypothetical protein WC441_03735 [Patescibacteria group bacterium]
MKSFVIATVVLFGILANYAVAQVTVTVKGIKMVQVNKVVARSGEVTTLPGLSCEQEVTLNIMYVEGDALKKTTITKKAGDCQIVLEKTGSGLVNTYVKTVAPARPENPVVSNLPSSQPADNSGTQVNLKLFNGSDKAFAALSGPFKNVAIQPLDTSKFSITVSTGVLNFPIIFTDTADNKQLRQIVVTRIITQDMVVLDVKNSDFGIAMRDKTKLYMYNDTKTKFVITNGIFSGYAISPGGRCKKKLQLSYGFQNFVIEFYGEDGLKRRANLEKIVTPQDPVIRVTEKDQAKAYIVQE